MFNSEYIQEMQRQLLTKCSGCVSIVGRGFEFFLSRPHNFLKRALLDSDAFAGEVRRGQQIMHEEWLIVCSLAGFLNAYRGLWMESFILCVHIYLYTYIHMCGVIKHVAAQLGILDASRRLWM